MLKWILEKIIFRTNNMSNTNSMASSSSKKNSIDGTGSAHTQSDLVSPPIQNNSTFNIVEHFANNRRWSAVKSLTHNKQTVSHAKHTHKPFRKCQSFVHLSKISSDRVHNSLINHHETMSNTVHLLNKSSSSPCAIYTAIKQEHRYFAYRIFSRCKVVFLWLLLLLLCFVDLLFLLFPLLFVL